MHYPAVDVVDGSHSCEQDDLQYEVCIGKVMRTSVAVWLSCGWMYALVVPGGDGQGVKTAHDKAL